MVMFESVYVFYGYFVEDSHIEIFGYDCLAYKVSEGCYIVENLPF